MSELTYPITAEDFALFKRDARYWVDRLGLKQWEVLFGHEDFDDPAILAQCVWQRNGGQIAKLRLNTVVDSPDNPPECIARAAFHETCELLLSDITTILWEHISVEVTNKKTHEVIRTLENVFWEPYWEAKQGGA